MLWRFEDIFNDIPCFCWINSVVVEKGSNLSRATPAYIHVAYVFYGLKRVFPLCGDTICRVMTDIRVVQSLPTDTVDYTFFMHYTYLLHIEIPLCSFYSEFYRR